MPRKPCAKRAQLEASVLELSTKYPSVKFELCESSINGKPDFCVDFRTSGNEIPKDLFQDLYKLSHSYYNVGFGGG